MERSSPNTLYSIQALRALAAAWVVIYHQINAERVYGAGVSVLGGPAHFGFAGVDLFFVISGFIMATVTSGRFGKPSAAVDFLGKRVVRIYPLYWICTAAILAVLAVRPSALDPALAQKSVMESLLLLPVQGGPLLVVGWTLTYELYFYVLTAIALAAASQRTVPWLLGAWAVGLALAQLLPAQSPWAILVTSPLAFEFIAGALAGLYWRRLTVAAAWGMLAVGITWLLGACALLIDMPNHGESPSTRTLAFGPAAALIVAGLARLELADKIRVPRVAVLLGDASYSLYLTHLFVLSICGRLAASSAMTGSASGNWAFFIMSFIATCCVAMIVHRLIERPMLRLGHGAWRRLQGMPKRLGQPLTSND